jgi:hypothetical protein
MGCNVHDILNKVVDYDTRKEKPKIVCIFWYDSNYDIFSRLYAKSSKLYTHWKTHIYTTMINTKHVIYGGKYMYF